MAAARRRYNLDRLVARHLFQGVPYIFRNSPTRFDVMKDYFGAQLGVPSAAICVVGSSRLGYSLNPDHPGQVIRDDSDVDIIVADETLFDSVWRMLLLWKHPWHMQYWTPALREWGTRRLEDFLAGHVKVNELVLTGGQRLYRDELREFKDLWFRTFKGAGQYRADLAGFEFKGRLYRSWAFATIYHAEGLKRLTRITQP